MNIYHTYHISLKRDPCSKTGAIVQNNLNRYALEFKTKAGFSKSGLQWDASSRWSFGQISHGAVKSRLPSGKRTPPYFGYVMLLKTISRLNKVSVVNGVSSLLKKVTFIKYSSKELLSENVIEKFQNYQERFERL